MSDDQKVKFEELQRITVDNLPLIPQSPFAVSVAKYLPCLRKLAKG